ncbi:hypothetical protein A9179_19795 [Pseudomonas alcaligenes]|uniref:DUF6701 domain-containing protein n=1 Tax=Aquipseudomonas alcaligenes TaxID=43263 RepID=A0ABR7S632_AQUAC|nr:hypothetical protein [Pseudomonas alcaligenes]
MLSVSNNSDITVVATGTISLVSTTAGSSARNISLQTGSGTLTTSGTTTIYGSVTASSGTISLSGTTVSGAVAGTGALNLSGGSVAGNVSASGNTVINGTIIDGTLTISSGTLNTTGGSIAGNVSNSGAITTNGTSFGGTLTSTSGSISLTGGSVTGLVRSNCCSVTTNGTDLSGGARSDSDRLSITGGTIAGTFYAGNNPATFTGVTMTSGSVSGASSATFTDSYLGSAESKVTVTTQSGAVNLNNTVAYGDFTAPNYSTINVSTSSSVTGTCLPNSTPANACNASVTPVCFTDSYNRTDLGTSDWAVTTRNGSFGVPKIVSNRLRLTDNTGNVATAATLQRLLPAKTNYVQVQFKYYAYNGNGADGVAVIFSNATQTPQPGGYGGSLGYAQLNGTSGFAGGWLGVALDEYGNFSNPTETRIGGPGLRQDSVSIRGSGSGTSDYRYLAGTSANLNPSLDVSGSTAGPGHTYRITLDSTVVGKTMVRVERNTGSGFTTLISSFDALTGTNQAALPSDFYLSFTGSTGGSNNIHELDDLQVCASKLNPIGAQIDHYEFSYASPALTCSPQPVTIKACLDSSCSSLYTDPVSVQLSPASGWTATSPATISGSTITFSGGTASAQLRSTAVGDVVVGTVANTSIPATKPLSTPVCSTSGCTISYADSGFLISVPNMIAVKPVTGSIKAIKKDDATQACVPGFASVTRTLSFTSGYSNPTLAASTAAGVTANQPVVINGTNVTTSATSLSLAFDATGSAPLTVRYDDAGQMALSATYTGSAANSDAGLSMTGSTTFRSRPYGLCLQTDSTCTVAGVSSNCVAFPGGIRAGDSFPLRVKAVGWQADGEALTAAALCTGNIVTPKFELSSIALSSALVEPAGGANGSVTPASYNHVLGSQTTASMSVSEVGVFRFTATPTASSYLGSETVSGGTSDLVGRFIPAYLGVTGSASLTPSCGTAYSYQGQPIAFASGQEPLLTVTGYNRQGAVTSNYDRGAFWRLNTPTRDAYLSVISGRTNLNSRLTSQGTVTTTTVDASTGDGLKAFRWSGEQLQYTPAPLPVSDDYPVAASIRQGFSAANLTDQDGACYFGGGSACTTFSFDFGGSNVRLGRLRIGNARGSELQSLTLPVALESWQNVAGGSFQAETLDTCTTAAALGTVTLDNFTGNLALGETTPASTAPSSGAGSLLLSAPGSGNDGSVQASYQTMPSWLYFAWDGATRSAARGLASFGIYRGATPLIYRRELYR